MARKMKDSGIEWIGEIPEGWETCLYKYCCSVQPGYPFDSAKFSNSSTDGFPLIRIRDITSGEIQTYYTDSYDSSYIITAGDLLVGMDGDFNVRWWNNFDALLNQRCCRIIEKGRVSRRFIYYVLPFTLQYINTLTYATTVKHLANGDILNSFIAFPSLSIQKNITCYLDKNCSNIDSILSKTRASIEEYKKLKQAVITQAVTKGVRGEREMEDSGVDWIGEIPKEWDIIKSSRIIKTTQNGLSRRDLEKSEGQIILKLKNITSDGKIDYSFLNRITLSQNELNTYALTTGDFLFVRVNGSKSLVGKCAIFEAISEIVAYNDHIIRVKLSNQCYNRFFLWYLYSCCGKAEIDLHTSTAAGQYTISGDGLRDITLVFPPIDEQKEIADYLDAKCAEIDGLIAKKEQLVKELESYKKSLIYEVVTGKREV